MKNTIADLNNYLFEQLERLNDDDLTAAELETQIKKTKAINEVAKNIIDNNRTVIEAQKVVLQYSADPIDMNPLIEMK